MSKSNVFETDLLELIFNGTTIADLAEDDTTSPATDLYVGYTPPIRQTQETKPLRKPPIQVMPV